jgi:hypothetical protein
MEDIQSRLPQLFLQIQEDQSEKNWEEIKISFEKLAWLAQDDSLSAVRGFLEVVDRNACKTLINGEDFSICMLPAVKNWVNCLVFRETQKTRRKELVSYIFEQIPKMQFFKISKMRVQSPCPDPYELVSNVVETFKSLRDFLMVACMHISNKFEKLYKKSVKTFINNTFSHEVALVVECNFSTQNQIKELVFEFSSRPSCRPGMLGITGQVSKSLYFGILEGESREGFGRISLVNGEKYEGFWKNDTFHGDGLYLWNKHEWFKGNFFNGFMHGKGMKRFKSGNVYVGEFFRGKMHGSGKMDFKNGDFYDGEWSNDCMNGPGSYFWAKSGDRFFGIMKQDVRISGVISLENGEEYKV